MWCFWCVLPIQWVRSGSSPMWWFCCGKRWSSVVSLPGHVILVIGRCTESVQCDALLRKEVIHVKGWHRDAHPFFVSVQNYDKILTDLNYECCSKSFIIIMKFMERSRRFYYVSAATRSQAAFFINVRWAVADWWWWWYWSWEDADEDDDDDKDTEIMTTIRTTIIMITMVRHRRWRR